MRKKLTYIIAFFYILIPAGMLIFNLGNNISFHNPILDTIVVLLLVPAMSISALFGFFGGRIGLVIGTIITIGITVFLIEWFFKKPSTD